MKQLLLMPCAVMISLLTVCLLWKTPVSAMEIKDVHSSQGVHAWLVEDHTTPVVSMQFSFAGGSTQDPAGKEGLVAFMMRLLGEGAGDLSADDFQARLDDIGAEVGFNIDYDRNSGDLRVLAQNREAAFQLLKLAVQQPRFDQVVIDRIRGQLVADLKAIEKNPAIIAQHRLKALIYGDHPYARRTHGTPESLANITRDDLLQAHSNIFSSQDVKVAIVGPMGVEETQKMLDDVFGGLPKNNHLQPIPDAQLNLGETVRVDYDLPQASMFLVYNGVRCNDPEFFPAYLMNYILGGSGLTSRLFTEVREKRGLAYSVNSELVETEHANALLLSTGTQAAQAATSLETIRAETKKMAENGVSAEELANAKSYVEGVYAIQNMRSSWSIAATLVGLQERNLPKDYISKRAAAINAVTLEQVQAVAQKLLHVEPALLVVGPAQN